MTSKTPRVTDALVPAQATEQWQRLQTALARLTDPVPCADDPEAWQPESRTDGEFASVAVRVCATSCPILFTCAMYAEAAGERHGVWGGQDRRPTLGRPRARAERGAW